MDYNPWNVASIHEFWSLKCPECVFDSKEEEVFQDHALRNHPLSFAIFGKTSTDVKAEYVDPFFETDEYHNNQDQISIKKELSSEFRSSDSISPLVNGGKKFNKAQRKRILEGKEPYHCAGCDKSFSKVNLWRKHRRTFHKCSICKINFDIKENLDDHNLTAHEEINPPKIHICSSCEYSCSKLFDLKVHIAQVHENIAPFECPGCIKSFEDNFQLKSHFKQAHSRIGGDGKGLKFEEKDQNENQDEDQNQEQNENQNKQTAEDLQENLQLKESNSTESEITQSTDATKVIKEENMLDINDIKSEIMSPPFHEVENVQEGKRYQCNFCEKSFANFKYGIQKHIEEVHEGKKGQKSEFECPNCENSFAKECTLKQHIHYVHEGKKLVNCYIYEQETGYNIIMSTVHEEEKPHMCYCGKSYNIMKSLKMHVKEIHEKTHLCHCGKSFDDKETLKRHVKLIHEGTCSICEKNHDEKKDDKDGNKTFECSECSANFDNNCVLIQHAISAHEGKKLVECYKYNHKTGMIICHMATLKEGEKPNKCLTCDKSFSSYYCLRKHGKQCGKEKKRIQCSKCDKKLTKNALKLHMKTVHERIYPFLCNTCGYKATYKAVLKNHIALVHEGKRHICSICGVGVTSPTYLKKHIESVHEGVKRYMCEICDFRSYEPSGLKSHISKVHEKIKPFECNICHKFFGTKSEQNQHISAVHEGLRPHKCSHCDKKFSSRSTLDTHIKGVHEGRKVVCSECGASFSDKSTLLRHIKGVHEKATPFVCKICNHGFKQSGNLKYHMATVHRGIENI